MQRLTARDTTDSGTEHVAHGSTEYAAAAEPHHTAGRATRRASRNAEENAAHDGAREDVPEYDSEHDREERPAPASLPLVAGAMLGIGGVGAVLAFADIASSLRAPFTLFFLVVAPASAIAAALRGVDPLSRPVLAVAGAVALDLAVAHVMLALQTWSARGGVVVVGLLSLLLFLVACARRLRRHLVAGRAARAHG
ncbi:hypothetical protein [Streptomyces buecherae]|uniref:hypothetical protein n=1 Tax=Streptomyces buecherae TaxID=2763006 RepID=UPI001E350D25|nr:hypothetical protein [Streptomyces buecherae]